MFSVTDRERDEVVALACVRHGLPAREGRGVDDLPRAVRDAIGPTVAQSTTHDELRRAFACSLGLLLDGVRLTDPDHEHRIRGAVRRLASSSA